MVPIARRLAAEGLGTFWVAPIIGALLAGFAYSWLAYDVGEPVVGDPEPTTA